MGLNEGASLRPLLCAIFRDEHVEPEFGPKFQVILLLFGLHSVRPCGGYYDETMVLNSLPDNAGMRLAQTS